MHTAFEDLGREGCPSQCVPAAFLGRVLVLGMGWCVPQFMNFSLDGA